MTYNFDQFYSSIFYHKDSNELVNIF